MLPETQTTGIAYETRLRRVEAVGYIIRAARKVIGSAKGRNQKGLPGALSELEHVVERYDETFGVESGKKKPG